MVKYCFDEYSMSHTTVLFVTDVLARAARASSKDLVQIVNDVKAFGSQLPF